MERDAQFLDYVIKGLVDNPDKVVITRTVDEMGVLLTLSVDPIDMGKIIGRNGHTAQAIRTVMKAFGKKHQANISIQIKEPEGGVQKESKTVDEAVADLNIE